jgi:glycosyltransferase involved in cell wall biosynthesis
MHDLNTRVFPSSYSPSFRLLYRLLLPTLGRRAETIATVSTYSAGELVKYGICPADRIRVIPNGHEHALRWRAQHSDKTNAASGRDTIVIVGSRAPHKNIGLITALCDKLKAAGLRLAVAGLGEQQVFASDSISPVASDNVTWLGRLSDDELAALLRGALCLAFPSFVEGFGLPALEAMALGCPVVASDRASLPEICADAALYASPDDGDQWMAHFIRLQNDEELRATLARRGSERARQFSWNQSAEKYLLAMAAADGVFHDIPDRTWPDETTAVDAARSRTPPRFRD